MKKESDSEFYTKYEKARIIGARALQLSMNAPILLKISKEELEKLKYDPLKIAELEFISGILPITVRRPLPQKAVKEIEEAEEEVEEIEEAEEEIEKPEKVEEKKEVIEEVPELPEEAAKAEAPAEVEVSE